LSEASREGVSGDIAKPMVPTPAPSRLKPVPLAPHTQWDWL
jgi:hypothetical protein